MRSTNLLVIALLAFLSCTTPVATTITPIPGAYSVNYWGDISATRQGVPLQNPRIAAISRTPCNQHAFDVTITEFDDDGDKLSSLTLFNIPKKATTSTRFKVDYQSLYCGSDTIGCTFTATSDQLPWGTYKPLAGKDTQLVIQSFDTISGEIKGTFSVMMLPDRRQDASAPDILQIKNGKFLTKLKLSNGTYKP